MKKPTAFWMTLAIVCVFAISFVFSHTAGASSGKPAVAAQAAILINAVNGEILFAKKADRVMAPASTTKIMTAILGLERGDLGRTVTVSTNAAAKDGSSMHLACNQRITLRNLLYGVLLISGNDAATAVAEYYILATSITGSIPAAKRFGSLSHIHGFFFSATFVRGIIGILC